MPIYILQEGNVSKNKVISVLDANTYLNLHILNWLTIACGAFLIKTVEKRAKLHPTSPICLKFVLGVHFNVVSRDIKYFIPILICSEVTDA